MVGCVAEEARAPLGSAGRERDTLQHCGPGERHGGQAPGAARAGAERGRGGPRAAPVMMSSMVPSLPSYTGRCSLAWRRRSSAISSCCCHLFRWDGDYGKADVRLPPRDAQPRLHPASGPAAFPGSPPRALLPGPASGHTHLGIQFLGFLGQLLLPHDLLLPLARFVLLLRFLEPQKVRGGVGFTQAARGGAGAGWRGWQWDC